LRASAWTSSSPSGAATLRPSTVNVITRVGVYLIL